VIALASAAPAWASCDPETDPTALQLQARELAARQDYDAALAALDCALARAPEDLDIRLARARILFWRGEISRARQEVDEVRRRRAAYPGLAELTSAIDGAREKRSAIFLATSISDLDLRGTHRRWTAVSLGGYRQISRSSTASFTLDHEDRVVAADTRAAIRIDRRWTGASAYVAVSATPSATFRERWGLGGGVELQTGALALIVDYRYAAYVGAGSHSISPSARMTFSKRVSGTIKATFVSTEALPIQAGLSGRVDADLGRRWTLSAGAASAPETEAGITRQVRGGFLGMSVPISRRADLRLTVDHERRDGTYTRTGLALGVAWRFGPD
jgi:YaiO family outer membrane protein